MLFTTMLFITMLFITITKHLTKQTLELWEKELKTMKLFYIHLCILNLKPMSRITRKSV